jgi:hypothetical protein
VTAHRRQLTATTVSNSISFYRCNLNWRPPRCSGQRLHGFLASLQRGRGVEAAQPAPAHPLAGARWRTAGIRQRQLCSIARGRQRRLGCLGQRSRNAGCLPCCKAVSSCQGGSLGSQAVDLGLQRACRASGGGGERGGPWQAQRQARRSARPG